jgi:hypothetical protein
MPHQLVEHVLRPGVDEDCYWRIGSIGLLAGAGCLVVVLAMLAIWVNGLIALFD